jgi:hypothetical protein
VVSACCGNKQCPSCISFGKQSGFEFASPCISVVGDSLPWFDNLSYDYSHD